MKSSVQIQVGPYRGPKSLGPYVLDQDVLMKSLLVQFGLQSTRKDIYCFEDKGHETYLYTRPIDDESDRVTEILLSSFPNCRGIAIHQTTIDPAKWKTPEGIGIGSTLNEVLQKYGKPSFQMPINTSWARDVIANPRGLDLSRVYIGDLRIVYSCFASETEGCLNDSRGTEFGFSKGKIIWIQVSNGE
jgi:hypothetical protein